MYISRNLLKNSWYSEGDRCRFSDANECSPVSRMIFDSLGIRTAMQDTMVKSNLETGSTSATFAGERTASAQGYYLNITSRRLYIWSFLFDSINKRRYFFRIHPF